LDLKPGILLTVNEVIVSNNLQQALVRVSVFPQENAKEIIKLLGRERKSIEYYLLKKIKIRLIPKLVFEIDRSLEQAATIEKLLLEDKNN
jgi:ribosome-binding factor A